jgi:hypothetical protein
MAFWTAAQIKSDQVKRAVWHIQRQQFEVYLPLCRRSRRSTRVVPLFVGYVFAAEIRAGRAVLGWSQPKRARRTVTLCYSPMGADVGTKRTWAVGIVNVRRVRSAS